MTDTRGATQLYATVGQRGEVYGLHDTREEEEGTEVIVTLTSESAGRADASSLLSPPRIRCHVHTLTHEGTQIDRETLVFPFRTLEINK